MLFYWHPHRFMFAGTLSKIIWLNSSRSTCVLRHICWPVGTSAGTPDAVCLQHSCKQRIFIYFFTLSAKAAAAASRVSESRTKFGILIEVAKPFIIFTPKQTNGITNIQLHIWHTYIPVCISVLFCCRCNASLDFSTFPPTYVFVCALPSHWVLAEHALRPAACCLRPNMSSI